MPAVSPPLLPIATCWWCLVILLLPAQALTQLDANTEKASLAGQAFPQLSLDGSPLNHLLLDPRSGQLYVGAVNHLHHLSSDLQVLSSSQTGPKLDSPECLPPIVSKDCPSARLTPNTNKILLLEEGVAGGRRLIVCGTLFQGICDKRSLGNVSEILYQTSNPVDTQYVAANDPRVSTVGVVLNQNGVGLMLVGRGYTSKGPSDIPPITTRRLASSSSPARQAFSQDEELGKLVVGSYSEYNNYFISAFSHSDHVYFLFSRRDVWHRKEYRTYVSRLCAGDRSFYSYVEVPLECSGGYNLAQGATLAEHQGQPALFVAMAAGQASTPSATDRSALCVYGISELDEALQRAQELCYTEGGRGGDGKEEAYIEYEVMFIVRSTCRSDSLKEYPCGGEHTPSPIASAVALSANPSLTRDVQLTAVTTVTEAGHTIALLGDKKGWLHKPNRTGMLYQSVLVDQNSPVNADLLLDQSKQNVYVLTYSKVSMVPVSECELQTDCQSCLSVRDPYCGWCVLEGRCLRRQDCHLESQANHWLWSYQPASQCVTVQSLKPANQSREEQTPVVAQLPTLSEDESLSCSFGTLPPQPAVVAGTTITCQSPLPELLPPNPPGSVCVCILTSVCVSSTVQLYDCAVGQSDCSQCRAVSSEYGCVWCGGESPGCVYNLSCTSPPGPVQTCPAPQITQIQPVSGPVEGGVLVTIHGSNLGMHYQDIQGGVTVAGVSCQPQPQGYIISTRIVCELKPSRQETEGPVIVTVGDSEPGQSLQTFTYQDPQLSSIIPDKGPVSGGTTLTIHGTQLLTGQRKDLTAYVGQQPCHMLVTSSDTSGSLCGSLCLCHYILNVLFSRGGRGIKVTGRNLDVVQQPMISVWVEPMENTLVRRRRYARLSARNNQVFNSTTPKVNSTLGLMSVMGVGFELDNVKVAFKSVTGKPFSYFPNPVLYALNRDAPETPYRFKPGGVIAVEGKDLTRAMTRGEVVARLGDQRCEVKTLDSTHLYCEPPETQPESLGDNQLPSLRVIMGKLDVDLGLVQYDADGLPPVPLAAQVGLAVGAAVVVLVVLVIILMYRRKSKQALRDYKKVLVQLETLEINVGDQCRKEFTDLMTEMMDLSSDVGGPGIPLLDYKTYAERVFFPGQRGAPLSQNLDLPESRRQTVEQGLGQLNNLLNNRLFLIRFIHTLEAQQNFSQRDRGHVASLLTMALHDKLEYFTDVMKTLLGDLTQQYVAKNPKLMLRRTETVVEKMLTNWMSICLYSFLKEVAGEPLYMLYRAIKYQVDKGPVDAVTGKAKRTLNDSHLLREDIDYCSITLTVLVKNGVEVQPCPVKVLDTDTITQVKDKILDQIYKGAPFSQRPAADSLDLEWRSGQAGHLTLSDDDVTAIVQGRWKKLNTLQHYKVTHTHTHTLNNTLQSAVVTGIHQTPMLEGEEEEGLRLWHLVKSSEDPEIPKHRKSSMRERERAKAIPEIYLTRLLSMKGTLQKFVDDVFVAILSTKRPPPIAVRFFFDFLDDMAEKHGIDDPETVHIWKTNSLPLRFWVNILKNPQFVFDVQVTDSVDAVLSVIAQTFIDSCTTSEHKVGRDSPVNKLLYAREIPRYKQLVERYYSDIHSAASGCYQEMNSTLTELSGVSGDLNLNTHLCSPGLQIIMSLEEDAAGQKMQLAYRLQQVAALVENKVTDL
uniref:Sema domain-containing protein n=1 Tax=Esox lucius TaxID=8010 RepID=A0A6Q2XHS7_ESOLU